MIPKPLAEIEFDDLQSLVEARTREARTLEYKLELPDKTDAEKKEFLADVSSLANAGGGDLIFGIRDEGGEAAEVVGLSGLDRDAEPLRLEHLIRDGVEPRIPGVHTHIVDCAQEGPVLIVRVPRSWAGPHMVVYKARSQFFSRSTNGKFPMDVSEIRAAFEGAADVPRQIREWRDDRLGRIIANEGPVQLKSTSCLVVHIIPVDTFRDQWQFDAEQLGSQQIIPIRGGSRDYRINVDGFVTFSGPYQEKGWVRSYTQLFRSGRIEAVASEFLYEKDGARWIPSLWYEQELLKVATQYMNALRAMGASPPMVFLLSMTHAKGAFMDVNEMFATPEDYVPVDRDLITFPDVVIEHYEDDLSKTLRPVFDAVWNACGHPRSKNYDENGNWNPR